MFMEIIHASDSTAADITIDDFAIRNNDIG